MNEKKVLSDTNIMKYIYTTYGYFCLKTRNRSIFQDSNNSLVIKTL